MRSDRTTVLEIVGTAVSETEPEIIVVTTRTGQGRATMRVSLQAARDLVAQLDYYVWKAGRTAVRHAMRRSAGH
jgi:hypothetical protein